MKKKNILLLIITLIITVIIALICVLNKKEEYYITFRIADWNEERIVTDNEKRGFETYLKDKANVKVTNFSNYYPGVYANLTRKQYESLTKQYHEIELIYPTSGEYGKAGLP